MTFFTDESGVYELDLDLPEVPLLDLPEPRSIPQALEDGRVRDLMNLSELDFMIRPIARRLAQVNRYAGALCWPLAVTTHSLLVSKLLENADKSRAYEEKLFGKTASDVFAPFAYHGLMHDVTEAFGIGDLIAPLKRSSGFEAYNEIESQIREQLCGPFALSLKESAEVRRADERAYQLECRYMRGSFPRSSETRFQPWYPTDAEHEAALFYCRQEISWRDSARLFIEAFERLAPAAVQERCL